MYNYIKQILAFLFPIVRQASLEVAVDALAAIAYPSVQRRRRYGRPPTGLYHSYNRFDSRTFERGVRQTREPYSGPTRDIFEKRGSSTVEDLGETFKDHGKSERKGFHDVLMVAFDIDGPNEAVVHEWLAKVMIPAKHYPSHDINIDSWWIADDGNTESDCDSAVFVAKGNQEAARKLLREHGLVH